MGLAERQDAAGRFAAALRCSARSSSRAAGRDRAPHDRPRPCCGCAAFDVANGATTVLAVGFYGYTLCNVLFLTGVWRYSILQAGLALMPGPVVAMAVAAVGQPARSSASATAR